MERALRDSKLGTIGEGTSEVQKLVIAREFASRPKVVIAHSPSRGLDVRATAAVHALSWPGLSGFEQSTTMFCSGRVPTGSVNSAFGDRSSSKARRGSLMVSSESRKITMRAEAADQPRLRARVWRL